MRREMRTTDFLDRAVDLYDDVTGVVAHDGTEYTYAELDARVNRLANALAAWGVERGDRVALLAPPGRPARRPVPRARSPGG